MKQRIFSRSKTLVLMTRKTTTFAPDDNQDMLQLSIAAYMLQDGDGVKVYHDKDMGGMVVEYQDEQ